MKLAVLVAVLSIGMGLSACTTPVTVLKNNKDQVIMCGGNTSSSIAAGGIGYLYQKSKDKDCVERYKKEGFKVTQSEERDESEDKPAPQQTND